MQRRSHCLIEEIVNEVHIQMSTCLLTNINEIIDLYYFLSIFAIYGINFEMVYNFVVVVVVVNCIENVQLFYFQLNETQFLNIFQMNEAIGYVKNARQKLFIILRSGYLW